MLPFHLDSDNNLKSIREGSKSTSHFKKCMSHLGNIEDDFNQSSDFRGNKIIYLFLIIVHSVENLTDSDMFIGSTRWKLHTKNPVHVVTFLKTT
jgi:hypothetical protein